jgi:hypothetical protein
VAQRASGFARVPDDVYETPSAAVMAVVPVLRRAHCSRILEPANGPNSKLATALRQAGFKVTTTTGDFLSLAELPDKRITCICTNPPYGQRGRLACEFIRHALDLVPIVAVLLRVDFDSGRTRVSLFRDGGRFAHKIVLLDRIKWFPGKKDPSVNHAWYLFGNNRSSLPTISYARCNQESNTKLRGHTS